MQKTVSCLSVIFVLCSVVTKFIYIFVCPGIQVMLSKNNMYRTSEWAQHHSSTDDDDDAVEANSPTGTIDIADKRDDDVALTMDDERFDKAVRKHLSRTTDKSSKRVAKLVLMEIKQYGGRLLQTHRSGTGRSPIVGYTSLNDVDAKGSELVLFITLLIVRECPSCIDHLLFIVQELKRSCKVGKLIINEILPIKKIRMKRIRLLALSTFLRRE